MASALSNLVDNLPEGIYKIKHEYWHSCKTVKRAAVNNEIVSVVSNINTLKVV